MKMEPVESSAIAAHGYDPATGRMRVKLHNGKVYEYKDISLDKYAAFTGAQSPGTFWNSKIKPMHTHREIKPEGTGHEEGKQGHTGQNGGCGR